ncbi:hypothetical protein DMA11_22180 [Marinilabiliaceae bacterium JC017]|nr:hypothetical protein DMA11_22180 [Marinilabiliaceae bacterium JC017]
MNFDFAEIINSDLENLDFEKAISNAESKLKEIPITVFHEVLGNSIINQAEEFAIWVEEFYNKVSEKINVKSLYLEMNEFDINTELWYVDCFAYERDGGLDLDDMEWLCEFQAATQEELGTIFGIEGYENIQRGFSIIEELKDNEEWSEEMQDARDWCEQIIIARFMEFIRAAHLTAKQKNLKWAGVPIYFAEHACELIVKSEL